MSEKLSNYRHKLTNYLAGLKDIRNVGLLAFVVIVLLTSWSGVKAIQANYNLQKQISELRQENQVGNLENKNLQLQNQYLTTDQYLDITARQNFGLGLPGETELLVPDSVAMAHTVKQPTDSSAKSSVPKQAFWQRNFEAWMDFFLHRQNP